MRSICSARIRVGDFLADKKRFESFKLVGAVSPFQPRRHSHSRSQFSQPSPSPFHLRPSLPLSFSSSSHDISLSTTSSSISSLSQLGSAPTNCSSHHWRCSSMSTRRESAAEVMGVTLLALLASNIEDNYRARRQGFYLSPRSMGSRGKTEPGRFLLSPVDIPERSTPEIEPRIGKPCWGQLQLWFEWPRQYLVEEEANEEDPMCLPHHSSCRHASPLLFAWF
ncbi:hypothetical protein BGW80DRAFT_1301461, partial [Lactifluus volemus]